MVKPAHFAAGLPPEVVEYVAGCQLGAYRYTYRAARIATFRVILMLVFGVASLVIGIGLYFLYVAWRTSNLNRRQAAKCLHFFEHGLVVADANGPVVTFRWDSLTALQAITRVYVNGVYTGTRYEYRLTNPDGSSAKLTEFYERPQEWGEAIQGAITEAQLPRVLAALERGERLQFGDLSLSREGLSNRKRTLRWEEFQEITVQQGYVRLQKSGKWLSWSSKPVKKIPNFLLFLAAADRLQRNREFHRH